MKWYSTIFAILVLFASCNDSDGQETPNEIQLTSLISNCDREREIFDNVENQTATIQSFDIGKGPYFFSVTTSFDSTDRIFLCNVEEKFKERGRRVSITGVLKEFSEEEKQALGESPSGTRVFLLEPTNIEFID